MKSCIVCFSRTGNTNLMAQEISKITQTPVFEIASTDPSTIKDYDVLILGTPVEAFRPAKETTAFLENIPQTQAKKAVLFCTYALWKGVTFRSLSKQLSNKGYECILKVSKKKVVPGQTDFSDVANQIKETLEKQQ